MKETRYNTKKKYIVENRHIFKLWKEPTVFCMTNCLKEARRVERTNNKADVYENIFYEMRNEKCPCCNQLTGVNSPEE